MLLRTLQVRGHGPRRSYRCVGVCGQTLTSRKKACLAALRIVKKAPEHAETFLEKLENPFAEKNHGALMCSVELIIACLKTEARTVFLPKHRLHVGAAVRLLKQLVLASKTSDYDVNGIMDPFLQVKILQFLRVCGDGSGVASEAMNDVLAQVITNTDGTKNTGTAVHYECVKTILAIEADPSLRTLAINTLGKFLTSTKDNNIRFVALAQLLHVNEKDAGTVQKHNPIIIDCLKDGDVSIRRRALELTVALIDASNVRILVPDLISYLSACDDEVKEEVAKQMCLVIQRKYPSASWYVEMAMRIFKVGKQFTPEEFALNFVAIVSQSSTEVQLTAMHLIWDTVSNHRFELPNVLVQNESNGWVEPAAYFRGSRTLHATAALLWAA